MRERERGGGVQTDTEPKRQRQRETDIERETESETDRLRQKDKQAYSQIEGKKEIDMSTYVKYNALKHSSIHLYQSYTCTLHA